MSAAVTRSIPRRCKRRGWRRSLVCGSAPGWRYRLAGCKIGRRSASRLRPSHSWWMACWMFSSMARSMPAQNFARAGQQHHAHLGVSSAHCSASRSARPCPGQRRWICPGGSASGWRCRRQGRSSGRRRSWVGVPVVKVNQQGGRPSSAHSWRFRSSRMAASSRASCRPPCRAANITAAMARASPAK